jgi:hypothetical protein
MRCRYLDVDKTRLKGLLKIFYLKMNIYNESLLTNEECLIVYFLIYLKHDKTLAHFLSNCDAFLWTRRSFCNDEF